MIPNKDDLEPILPNPELTSQDAVLHYSDAFAQWWSVRLKREYARYEDLIGSTIEQYRASRTAAIAGLMSINARSREAALYVLETAYPKDQEVAGLCEGLIRTETDESVRIVAMGYVASSYPGSKRPEWIQMFAKIVASVDETEGIRSFAYWCLVLVVRGYWSSTKIISGDFQFPEDVNWGFVNACVKFGFWSKLRWHLHWRWWLS